MRITRYGSMRSVAKGFCSSLASFKSLSVKLSSFTIKMPLGFKSETLVINAAGFIAIRESSPSPGVKISSEAN